MSAPNPLVTVVVPTRNSAATLSECLRSVDEQDIAKEIIVVDNFSEDETAAVAESFRCLLIREGPERSAQRNLGAERGRAPWLAFIDSDMVLQKDVLQSCLSAASDSRADAIIIPELSVGEGLLARARSLEKRCYMNDEDIEAARFFSKEAFERLGGFDTRLFAGEDWDLTARARGSGLRIGRCSEPILHLEGRITLRGAIRKKFYYGKSLNEYRALQPAASRRQLTPFRSAFFRQWRLLARNPIETGALLVLKACELLGVLGGMLSSAASSASSSRRAAGRI